MKTNRFHLMAKENNWVLTREGMSKPLGKYKSKDAALECALDIVAAETGSLKMHRRDGTVAEGRLHARKGAGLRCLPVHAAPSRARRGAPAVPRLVPQPA
jgi:hypothetical protein